MLFRSLKEVTAIDPERVEHVRQRLNKGVADLKENIDQNRFEQELIYILKNWTLLKKKLDFKTTSITLKVL